MQLSKQDIVLSVLEIIFGLTAIVFSVADFANWWANANAYWNFAFAALCAVDCVKQWKPRRKTAIVELICAVVLLASGVIGLVVK